MSIVESFDQFLFPSERKVMAGLRRPIKIQDFLDSLTYGTEMIYRCPLRVLRERTAHCFDGALFAAAALRRIGFLPLILEMLPNDRDDDHLLSLYKVDGHWGAVAKSNYVGLRYREPVYRNLRELVMSYFEQYYNIEGEKTLRGYTSPLHLTTFDRFGWMASDEHLGRIADRLEETRKMSIITSQMSAGLSPIDPRSYQAGLFGAIKKGLYQPSRRKR